MSELQLYLPKKDLVNIVEEYSTFDTSQFESVIDDLDWTRGHIMIEINAYRDSNREWTSEDENNLIRVFRYMITPALFPALFYDDYDSDSELEKEKAFRVALSRLGIRR